MKSEQVKQPSQGYTAWKWRRKGPKPGGPAPEPVLTVPVLHYLHSPDTVLGHRVLMYVQEFSCNAGQGILS